MARSARETTLALRFEHLFSPFVEYEALAIILDAIDIAFRFHDALTTDPETLAIVTGIHSPHHRHSFLA